MDREVSEGPLGALLQNPALLQGALSLLGGFLQDEEESQDSEACRRRTLLLAVKPYLGQARQAHLEQLLQILQIVDRLQSSGKEESHAIEAEHVPSA